MKARLLFVLLETFSGAAAHVVTPICDVEIDAPICMYKSAQWRSLGAWIQPLHWVSSRCNASYSLMNDFSFISPFQWGQWLVKIICWLGYFVSDFHFSVVKGAWSHGWLKSSPYLNLQSWIMGHSSPWILPSQGGFLPGSPFSFLSICILNSSCPSSSRFLHLPLWVPPVHQSQFSGQPGDILSRSVPVLGLSVPSELPSICRNSFCTHLQPGSIWYFPAVKFSPQIAFKLLPDGQFTPSVFSSHVVSTNSGQNKFMPMAWGPLSCPQSVCIFSYLSFC